MLWLILGISRSTCANSLFAPRVAEVADASVSPANQRFPCAEETAARQTCAPSWALPIPRTASSVQTCTKSPCCGRYGSVRFSCGGPRYGNSESKSSCGPTPSSVTFPFVKMAVMESPTSSVSRRPLSG